MKVYRDKADWWLGVYFGPRSIINPPSAVPGAIQP